MVKIVHQILVIFKFIGRGINVAAYVFRGCLNNDAVNSRQIIKIETNVSCERTMSLRCNLRYYFRYIIRGDEHYGPPPPIV